MKYKNSYRTFYEGLIMPEKDIVFVFGSNPEGRHGAGAARVAIEKFDAIYGQGEGLQGNAYALPTKDLKVKENNGLRSIGPEKIIKHIQSLYECALDNPQKKFCVAYTNTNNATLNGYTGIEMAQMFKSAALNIPKNIIFSINWEPYLKVTEKDILNRIFDYVTSDYSYLSESSDYSKGYKAGIKIVRENILQILKETGYEK